MKTPLTIGIAPNAFKGSLSALQAAQAIQTGLDTSRLRPKSILMPLADGGDGTLEVLLSQAGSQRVSLEVQNALGEAITAEYGFLGETAFVEMALASGLAQLGPRLRPLEASSYGTGQLMRHALQQGAKRLIVGLGGSATTDGGAGCLQALGFGLDNAQKYPIERGGGSLHQLVSVKITPILKGIELLVLCDVDNPPLGEKGAAAIFAPQKGASPQEVQILEQNLSHFFRVLAEQGGVDVRTLAGGGAAGALAGGLAALAGGRLVSGAKTLVDMLGYREKLATCDLIITGEGALDPQTAQGKAPMVIAELAAEMGIPTLVLAGSIPTNPQFYENSPIQAAFSLLPRLADFPAAQAHSATWLQNIAYQIGNLLALHKP